MSRPPPFAKGVVNTLPSTATRGTYSDSDSSSDDDDYDDEDYYYPEDRGSKSTRSSSSAPSSTRIPFATPPPKLGDTDLRKIITTLKEQASTPFQSQTQSQTQRYLQNREPDSRGRKDDDDSDDSEGDCTIDIPFAKQGNGPSNATKHDMGSRWPSSSSSSDVESAVEDQPSPVKRNPQNLRLKKAYVAFVIMEHHVSRTLTHKIMNTLASFVLGTFNHCEMVYKLDDTVIGDEVTYTCSVNCDSVVTFRESKNYWSGRDTQKWECIEIKCTIDQLHELYEFCADQAGKPYNTSGYYRNFWPSWISRWIAKPTDQESWVCSELVMASLLKIHRPRGQYPPSHLAKPSDIRDFIRNEGLEVVGCLAPKNRLMNTLEVI